MDNSLRTQKELIKMREAALSDWRADLNEEHPYVEVMPAPGMDREDKKKVLKKGIEAKKEQGMKESKDLDKIAKELDGAVEMHASQAKRLRKHSKDMKEEKNCGCGKDPCITYGKKEKK